MDFQALGGRRNVDTQAANGPAPALSTRGFTGHEMVDGFSLVHMNARLYDVYLGRFLQADPLIQAPANAQSWNAYTYCLNNPLTYTDPTGAMSAGVRRAFAFVIGIVAAYFGQYYISHQMFAVAFAVSVGGAFVAGAVASQSLKGGLQAAFGAALTFGVGVAGWNEWQTIATQAVSGGVMESLQGGNFGNGFFAAGVTALTMPRVGRIDNNIGRTITGALVGGTISEATGGKFANGAMSGAIQAAMAERREVEARTRMGKGNGDGTEGAPDDLKPMIRDPAKREQFLNELAGRGWATMSGRIRYEDRYYPGDAGTGAVTTERGTTFYKRTFEFDYDAILSAMDHEYVHVWQFKLGLWDGVREGTPEALALELKAYDVQMRLPNFSVASDSFRAGTSLSRTAYEDAYFLSCRGEDCAGIYP